MLSNLEYRPYTEVIAMLERLAKKNDLLLSTNLIDFADDVWLEATKDNRQSEWTAEKFEPISKHGD